MCERFEWMDTILTEWQEWLEYERDMETDPYNDANWTDHMEEDLARAQLLQGIQTIINLLYKIWRT